MIVEFKPSVFGNHFLATLNFFVKKLHYFAALHAYQMVMVSPFIQAQTQTFRSQSVGVPVNQLVQTALKPGKRWPSQCLGLLEATVCKRLQH